MMSCPKEAKYLNNYGKNKTIDTAKHLLIRRLASDIVSYLRIRTGIYKRVILPEFDFSTLTDKWPYNDCMCFSRSYSRTNAADTSIDLSICIPMFNVERSIIRLLEQIETQKTSYKKEILLVDDGSTDRTAAIVEKFIEGKNDYRLIRQINMGLSVARNTAIDHSSGDYITFIDSDDEICEGFIENLMSVATLQNADIVIGEYYSRRGNVTRNRGGSSFAWGRVYRSSLFEQIRFPAGYWYEDMIIDFLLIPLSEKTVKINVPVIIYNDVDGSLSRVQRSSETYKSLEQLYLVVSLINDYKALGLTDSSYLHKRILIECSQLMVRRTEMLDEDTKKQVFLACNKIFTENEISEEEFSGIDRVFAKAILERDYIAWRLAADVASLSRIIHAKTGC